MKDASNTTLATYRWLPDGTKLGVSTPANTGFEYLGSLIYTRTGANAYTLESAPFDGGRIIAGSSYVTQYFVTDHLGSTRVAFNQSGTDLDRSDYYPTGERWADPALPASTNRWQYNGKERQTTGMPTTYSTYLDYGARMYDSKIGRWHTIDKLAEKYYAISPYVYALNNPIRFIDPDGNRIVDTKGNLMWNNGGWTQHATEGAKRIGDNMMRSHNGYHSFMRMADTNNPQKITMTLNTTDTPTEAGQLIRGEVRYSHNSESTADNIMKFDMIIYEKNIIASSEKTKIPVDDQIAATGAHEDGHMTPENISQVLDNIYNGGTHDVEKAPKAAAASVLKDFENQKPVLPANVNARSLPQKQIGLDASALSKLKVIITNPKKP